MIIDFTVKNFRSIREEQTFSMLATKPKDEHSENIFQLENEKSISLLKTAIIYGANASGKSNLIQALQAFMKLIINSTDLKLMEDIPGYEPYRLDKSCLNKPTKFEIEFISNDRNRYKYTVIFNKKVILFEELVFYPKKQEARIFLREEGKEMQFGSHLKGKKQSIASELIENNLFLSKAANSNHEQLKEIYLYFLENTIFHLKQGGRPHSYTTTQLTREDNANFKKKLINLLMAADTGIHSIDMVEIDLDETITEDTPEFIRKQILELFTQKPITYHKLYENGKEAGVTHFDLNEESNGTIKMYELAGKIITVIENGYTAVIDELDSSLHPLLSEYIIKLFNDPESNPKNAQLIVATHDTSLLNPQLLRRDQVWFTKKNNYGATQVYSLDEFDKNEVRKNTPFDKWYLNGRFDAIPLINKSLFKPNKN
ncbi:MAG: ATP-binding protein [bacterium]|nr:ATP-binding protein [bacterium]